LHISVRCSWANFAAVFGEEATVVGADECTRSDAGSRPACAALLPSSQPPAQSSLRHAKFDLKPPRRSWTRGQEPHDNTPQNLTHSSAPELARPSAHVHARAPHAMASAPLCPQASAPEIMQGSGAQLLECCGAPSSAALRATHRRPTCLWAPLSGVPADRVHGRQPQDLQDLLGDDLRAGGLAAPAHSTARRMPATGLPTHHRSRRLPARASCTRGRWSWLGCPPLPPPAPSGAPSCSGQAS
jgi:hypothetical protein